MNMSVNTDLHRPRHEKEIFLSTISFFKGRLEDVQSVELALNLDAKDDINRAALTHLVGDENDSLSEPWNTAWHLIVQSFSESPVMDTAAKLETVKKISRRIEAADHLLSVVSDVLDLVGPRLEIRLPGIRSKRRMRLPQPRSLQDLVSARLTSVRDVNPRELGIYKMDTPSHLGPLLVLAQELLENIEHSLALGREVGWSGDYRLTHIGNLYRVDYVRSEDLRGPQLEPDTYHRGISPSVKLLHAVVEQLAVLQHPMAKDLIRSWKESRSPIYLRLWAALSLREDVSTPDDVGDRLLRLSDREFWDMNHYPEIAVLRAKRFPSLRLPLQLKTIQRIRSLPPRDFWPPVWNVDPSDIRQFRLNWAVQELRRIEIGGTELPPKDQAWLESRLEGCPSFLHMRSVTDGLLETHKPQWIPPNPDSSLDLVDGRERLRRLQSALSSPKTFVSTNESAHVAFDWLNQEQRVNLVLADLQTVGDDAEDYPHVWNMTLSLHGASAFADFTKYDREIQDHIDRILVMIIALNRDTVRIAIQGISQWVFRWKRFIVMNPTVRDLWSKLWPAVVSTTEHMEHSKASTAQDLITPPKFFNLDLPFEDQVSDTPIRYLVESFIPRISDSSEDFGSAWKSDILAEIYVNIMQTRGPTGLIAKAILVRHIREFVACGFDEVIEQIRSELLSFGSESVFLWEQNAQHLLFDDFDGRIPSDLLPLFGDELLSWSIDERLNSKTQRLIALSLVCNFLHSYYLARSPVVNVPQMQSILRSLDADGLSQCSHSLFHFVQYSTVSEVDGSSSSARRFRLGVSRFLKDVWPHDQDLATSDVRRWILKIPAASREAFAEAVNSIDRFLVPSEVSSLGFFFLEKESVWMVPLEIVNDEVRARALLQLLDKSIGSSENSVIPFDLSDALDQVIFVSEKFGFVREYRRLITLARRA